jgi:gas vesicle protein
MQDQFNGSASRRVVVFLGGAIVGAAAGLLFAPKAGRETRKELKGYANKVSKEVAQVAQRTKSGIEAALEKGRALLESRAA